jgi:four helix bundle protein
MKDYQYSFENLKVWTDIRALIKTVYSITATYPDVEKFGLVNQMRRAAVPVSLNLAEGSSRTNPKDQAHFYQVAFSSIMELLSQSVVSQDLSFFDEKQRNELRDQINEVASKINALRRKTLERAG